MRQIIFVQDLQNSLEGVKILTYICRVKISLLWQMTLTYNYLFTFQERDMSGWGTSWWQCPDPQAAVPISAT
jgi:hypothetical protein